MKTRNQLCMIKLKRYMSLFFIYPLLSIMALYPAIVFSNQCLDLIEGRTESLNLTGIQWREAIKNPTFLHVLTQTPEGQAILKALKASSIEALPKIMASTHKGFEAELNQKLHYIQDQVLRLREYQAKLNSNEAHASLMGLSIAEQNLVNLLSLQYLQLQNPKSPFQVSTRHFNKNWKASQNYDADTLALDSSNVFFKKPDLITVEKLIQTEVETKSPFNMGRKEWERTSWLSEQMKACLLSQSQKQTSSSYVARLSRAWGASTATHSVNNILKYGYSEIPMSKFSTDLAISSISLFWNRGALKRNASMGVRWARTVTFSATRRNPLDMAIYYFQPATSLFALATNQPLPQSPGVDDMLLRYVGGASWAALTVIPEYQLDDYFEGLACLYNKKNKTIFNVALVTAQTGTKLVWGQAFLTYRENIVPFIYNSAKKIFE